MGEAVPLQHLEDALALLQPLPPPQGRGLRLQHRNPAIHTTVELLLDRTALLAAAAAIAVVVVGVVGVACHWRWWCCCGYFTCHVAAVTGDCARFVCKFRTALSHFRLTHAFSSPSTSISRLELRAPAALAALTAASRICRAHENTFAKQIRFASLWISS